LAGDRQAMCVRRRGKRMLQQVVDWYGGAFLGKGHNAIRGGARLRQEELKREEMKRSPLLEGKGGRAARGFDGVGSG